MTSLPPQYNPQQVEERLYQWWESQGLFHADVARSRRPYTIVIPPPNVTGILHMGHALNNTIQDLLIRMKRMQGYNTLWVPGTDHAGIATQNVVEKALAKDGKRRQDLGREAFLQRVWEWNERYGNTILYQLRRLGASCDWPRARFTMDAGLSEAVAEVFIALYTRGLIYRGNYIINWCPRCQTALANEEAPRLETHGKLYHIRYPLAEGSGLRAQGSGQLPPAPSPQPPAFIEVATTRPETMLGDTAVAVHPKDPRYRALIGRSVMLPLVNRRLPIIGDERVDMSFGTGAVKVTPAHDPVDFQLGKTHRLEFLNVMTGDARMTSVPAAYEGLDRFDCRSKLIVDLEQGRFLGAIDEHVHHVGHCYRCQTVVEPRLSLQWFVKMQPLAKPAIAAVKRGTIRFVPERWTKVYLNWMEHLEDWCISRQIWWGHRLPVYYCTNCAHGSGLGAQGSEDRSGLGVRGSGQLPTAQSPQPPAKGVIVARMPPARCPACGGTELRQDEDVLDTWFSSWLWPFSTLGWPKATKELRYFYPTDTLVTAQEIIFFWVARMIMAGYFCMKRPSFRTVYIHGTVRDITGKKMSKSLGNIIDPLEIIQQYGTDALRYTLVTATAIGQDVFLSEERFTAGRNFANKLWNATRFILTTAQGSRLEVRGKHPRAYSLEPRALSVADRWILSRLQRTVERVTASLERFLFSEAATTLYDFLWHDVCDWYLEIVKVQLQHTAHSTQHTAREHTIAVLIQVLEASLRLLHPIMPFVTEELWQHLQADPSTSSIMVAPWPKVNRRLVDAEAERQMERFKAVVGSVRNARAELHVPVESRPPLQLVVKRQAVRAFFETHRTLVQAMARAGEVRVQSAGGRPRHAAAMVVDGVEVYIPLAGLIDLAREGERLQQRVDELTQELTRLEARLGDPQFTGKAPRDVVEQVRSRRAQIQETLQKLSEHLAILRE